MKNLPLSHLECWDEESNPKFEIGMWAIKLGCWQDDVREILAYGIISERHWDKIYGTHRYSMNVFTGGTIKDIFQQDIERYYMPKNTCRDYMRSCRLAGVGK